MSRLLSIFMFGLYGLTLSQAYLPHINYWMNRDFIAAELCENKDRPELQCNGKCHLKKEIKENEENRSEDQEVANNLMLEFFESSESFRIRLIETSTNCCFLNYNAPLVAGEDDRIFRPPRA